MRVSGKDIKKTVRRYFGIPARDFEGATREPWVSRRRHLAMYLVRRTVSVNKKAASYPLIGSWFGRDHSTIIYAERQVARRLLTDPKLESDRRKILKLLACPDERRLRSIEDHRQEMPDLGSRYMCRIFCLKLATCLGFPVAHICTSLCTNGCTNQSPKMMPRWLG